MIKGFTYIMTNKNFTVLYVGATKDLKYRIACHKDGTGAIFTKKYNKMFLENGKLLLYIFRIKYRRF